jgi:RNA polymerase sigma-70 factor, ECF subfamily
LATAVGTVRAPAVAVAGALELEDLFRAHNASVLCAALRITGSVADAEDVAQLVFLRIARQGLDHRRVRDMGSYLRRAAVNSALDLLRSRSVRLEVPMDELASRPLPLPLSPEQEQSSAELRSRLRKALAKLHPTAAEMFALRYFEGFNNREIARLMQTSQAVVAVTLHRARSRLRKELRAVSK